LCSRLEGLPLAIELAAARAQMLAPAQMLARLNERFDLLATRRADKSSRHRSLWAAIAWSYDLLPLPLQRFFASLSVFRGGFDLEAAEAVAWSDGPPLHHSTTPSLHLLTQLRERSLLLVEEAGEAMRYRLIESLREFAEEQLTPDEMTDL